MANPNNELGIPNLEEYYALISVVVSFRAACLNRAVGAVLVSEDNKSIIATGYNSPPANLPHCQTCRRRDEGYGPGEGLHRSRATHAEANVIVQAAKYGRIVNGCIMYITDMPCSDCCKLIINSGIKKVCYLQDYPGSEAKDMLSGAGIEIKKLDRKKILKYLISHSEILNEQL